MKDVEIIRKSKGGTGGKKASRAGKIPKNRKI
jgi:hypothetical protein